jgi:hypothetical protein
MQAPATLREPVFSLLLCVHQIEQNVNNGAGVLENLAGRPYYSWLASPKAPG